MALVPPGRLPERKRSRAGRGGMATGLVDEGPHASTAAVVEGFAGPAADEILCGRPPSKRRRTDDSSLLPGATNDGNTASSAPEVPEGTVAMQASASFAPVGTSLLRRRRGEASGFGRQRTEYVFGEETSE